MGKTHSENTNLEKVKRGDVEAIAQIFNNHKDMIYNYALKILKNPPDADEAVSRTYLRFLKYAHTIRKGPLPKWLVAMAKNVVKDIQMERADYSEKVVRIEELDEGFVSEIIPNLSLEEICWKKKESEEVSEAVKSLPKNQKDALLLYYQDGYHYKEIAKILGKTEGAIKSLLFKAKKQLAEIISEKYPWLKIKYCPRGEKNGER